MTAVFTDQSLPYDRHFLLRAPLQDLLREASRVRREYCGTGMHVCSIMNAKSGACSEDCAFCAQSGRHAAGIQTYPLKSAQEIAEAAGAACSNGARHFSIVCSGNKLSPRELDAICEAVSMICAQHDLRVCASLGRLSMRELRSLRAAGLARYHHNIETSARYYPRIVTTHCYGERLETIQSAHEAGLEVCSGVIVGLGETWDDRIDMALLLQRLPVVSVPMNILIPIRGTRLAHQQPVSCVDIIRCIALFRIILRDREIKIAAGREAALKDFQAMGFSAGANGMLVGGYLTVGGRDIAADRQLIREVGLMWENGL